MELNTLLSQMGIYEMIKGARDVIAAHMYDGIYANTSVETVYEEAFASLNKLVVAWSGHDR
jgi:hypothetical protein